MRRLLSAFAVIGLAVAAWGAPAGAQEAASVAGTGWWSDTPTATPPEGGVVVGARPGGSANSVAAVRISLLSKSITSATLILQEAGGVNQSNGALKVCTTPNQWKTGRGPMAEAPKAECAGEAKLERNPSTGAWAGDVKNLLTASSGESTVSLMVVPASGGAVPVGFEISFQPPQIRAEGTTTASEFEAGPGFSSDDFSSDEFNSSSDSTVSDFSASSSSFADFAAPMTGAEEATAEAPVEATVAPVARSGDQEVAVGLPARATGLPTDKGRPIAQGVFFVLVAAAVGVVAGVGRNRLRQLQPG